MTQSKLRHFVFTINNPDKTPDEVWNSLQQLAKYLVFQKESGENGTIHYQGYCELSKRTSFRKVKDLIPTAHIEPRRGTQAQARSYATKEDTRIDGPFEYGEFVPNCPGKRNDLQDFMQDVRAGKRKRELLDDHLMTMARYPKLFDTISHAVKRERRLDLHVSLYWGAPGTGKTRAAFDSDPDAYVIPISDNLWFDGYDGQKTLILDDFTGWMKLDHLLRLLDIYPVQVQVKGGFTYLDATSIIVTSNSHFRDWYDWKKHTQVKYAALQRRFHEIKEFTDNTTDGANNSTLLSDPNLCSTSFNQDPNLY